MSNVSQLSQYRNGARAETDRRADNKLARIYDDPAQFGILDWPKRWRGYKGRSHPYNFQWRSPLIREKAVKLMVTPIDGRFRYATAEVLRLLLYRWNRAQYLTKVPMDFMRPYRWSFYSQAELGAELMMKSDQLRDLMKELEDRRLVVRVFRRNITRVAYYRPTDDLWRLCLMLTYLSDPQWLTLEYGSVDKEQMADCRAVIDRMFEQDWPVLHAIIHTYLTSDCDNRHQTMQDSINRLLESHMEALGMLDDDDSAEGAMYDELAGPPE
jgi:hypothetical protein